MASAYNYRILLIDNNPQTQEEFKKILNYTTGSPEERMLTQLKAELFGLQALGATNCSMFTVDVANNGREGLAKIQAAIEANEPYAVVFINEPLWLDIDSIEAIQCIWQVDSQIQVVVCSNNKDFSWEENIRTFGRHGHVLILKKPFDYLELQQMAMTLVEKWNLNEQLSRQLTGLHFLSGKNVAGMEKKYSLWSDNIDAFPDSTDSNQAPLTPSIFSDNAGGLPNRDLLIDRMTQALSFASRNHLHVAVLAFDLEGFNEIQATYGQQISEKILAAVTARLKNNTRGSDTLARLSGDQFILIAPAMKKPEYAVIVAQKCLEIFNSPFSIDENQLSVTTNIGISIYPNDGIHAEDLLNKASEAMCKAQKKGSNNFLFYVESK